MSPKQPLQIRIDDDLMEGLRRVRDRVGVPVSEQIRRAIRVWLAQQDDAPAPKGARKRAGTRKRA